MSFPYLAEGTVTNTITYLEANMNTALAGVKTERGDNQAVIEPPKSYFIYESARGYRAPAIFVLVDDFDFQNKELKPNFIYAIAKMRVSALLEDKDKTRLTYKAWRYESAMNHLLHLTQLISTDQRLTLDIIVQKHSLSPTFPLSGGKDSQDPFFRKEVLLECDVHHREQF